MKIKADMTKMRFSWEEQRRQQFLCEVICLGSEHDRVTQTKRSGHPNFLDAGRFCSYQFLLFVIFVSFQR
jgi:hypothetical protein